MPVLQAMDGKFYDIPDDQAAQFEVPREKVKELLVKSGVPATQGSPGPGQPQGQMQGQMQPGPGGAPGGPGGGPSAPPPSVLVQIYGAQPMQSYGPPPGQQQQPQAQGEPGQGGEGDGDVNPYWWWRNITFYRPWGNFWPNWGNW